MEEREVIRCGNCQLNQFMTRDQNCRRCRKSFVAPMVPMVAAPAVLPLVERPPFVGINWGHTFRVLRWSTGKSQRQIADLLGTPRTYVSKLENGKCTPTLSSLERIATALGINCFGLVWFAESIS